MIFSEHRLSVAPMLDRTDRDFRYFMRLISKDVLLYTEMITAKAILYGDAKRHLEFSLEEKPLVLQLGGDNPDEMQRASCIAKDFSYDALNLNVGCPSSRVQNGNFGACLMQEPNLVAELVSAMKESGLPVSVKCRLAAISSLSESYSYDGLARFVEKVSDHTKFFTIHARVAVLGGLSPKENRQIPPLKYDWVLRLKNDFPALWIELNGGIQNLEQAASFLQGEKVDSIMIGRAAYENPLLFAKNPNRKQILEKLVQYFQKREQDKYFKSHIALAHISGLYYGVKGSKSFRQFLARHHKEKASDVLRQLAILSEGQKGLLGAVP